MGKKSRQKSAFPTEQVVVSAVIFLAALFVRMLHLYAIDALPTFRYLTFDSFHFNAIAGSILQGQTLEHEAIFKAPLYSLLLVELYSFLSNSLFQVLAAQCVIGSFSAVMIYLIAGHLYPSKIARTAGAVAALFGTLIYFDAEILPATATVFLLLVTLYLLIRFDGSKRILYLAGAGISLALAAATTPESIIFLPFAIWWLIKGAPVKRRSNLVNIAVFVAALIVATLPFAVRGNSLGGEKVPYLTDLSVRFAIANQDSASGRSFILPNSVKELGQSYVNAIDAANRTNGREVSRDGMGAFWLSYGMGVVLSSPIQWIKLEFIKLIHLISGYEISTDKPIYYFAGKSFPLKVLLWDRVVAFPMGIVLPLAVIALFASGVGSQRKHRLLLFFAISMVIAVLLFDVFAHQRILIAPAVIIWAAVGFWALVDLYQKEEFRKFYSYLLIFVIAAIVSNGAASILGISKKVNEEFEGRMFTANALLTAGRFDEAEQLYQEASRLEPRSPRPFVNMATIDIRQAQDSLAILNFERAVGLDPADPRPLRGVASVLKRRQRIGDLNTFLVRVIEQYPKENWAYREYAELHIRLKEFTQAADIYERAFAADSTNFDAIFSKAETYLLADMRQEAESEFKRYLEYMPSSVDARANLGQVYARQRRIDEAKREFEYVRSLQPRNPAVYFNLASLYYQIDELNRAKSYLDTASALDRSFPGLDDLSRMIDSVRTIKSGTSTTSLN